MTCLRPLARRRRIASGVTPLLILTVIALAAPRPGEAQIETNPITEGRRLPPDVLRETDRDGVRRDISGLRIVDSTAARILSAENVWLQGVGDAVQYHVRYEITIENPGSETRLFRIITDIGGETRNRSTQFGIRAGQRLRKTQEFRFHLARAEVLTATGGLNRNARPVDVTLLDRDGSQHDHVALALESTRGAPAERPRLDLRVYRLEAELLAPGARGNRTKDWSLRATVSIANTGTQYWNDTASVTVTYASGRAGRTTPLEGTAGVTKPVPPGIRVGDHREMELTVARRLTTGWYTATARLTSRDDQDASNNISVFEFYVRDDRR